MTETAAKRTNGTASNRKQPQRNYITDQDHQHFVQHIIQQSLPEQTETPIQYIRHIFVLTKRD